MSKTQDIIPMCNEHVSKVTDIHLIAFQGFFLSSIGKRFLMEFYTGVIDDPSSIAFVIEANNDPVGFVVGSDHPNQFYRRMLRKRWWKFAAAAFPAVLSNPKIIPRLFRAFTMPNQNLPFTNCGTLMSIGVNPVFQGQGTGDLLVKAFLDEAGRRGLEAVNLTTDAVDNDYVNVFYQKLGFVLYRTFSTQEGRLMNEYVFFNIVKHK